jgi:hypothetical protein
MVSRFGFAVYYDGVPRHIRRGDVVAGDDPILKTHAAQFQPVDSLIEKATAWPGERRAVRFPERVTAQEASAAADTPHHRTQPGPTTPETTEETQEETVGHTLPPEHPDSPASPHAPFQPAANVNADDVPDEQNPTGGPRASEWKPPKKAAKAKTEAGG